MLRVVVFFPIGEVHIGEALYNRDNIDNGGHGHRV